MKTVEKNTFKTRTALKSRCSKTTGVSNWSWYSWSPRKSGISPVSLDCSRAWWTRKARRAKGTYKRSSSTDFSASQELWATAKGYKLTGNIIASPLDQTSFCFRYISKQRWEQRVKRCPVPSRPSNPGSPGSPGGPGILEGLGGPGGPGLPGKPLKPEAPENQDFIII